MKKTPYKFVTLCCVGLLSTSAFTSLAKADETLGKAVHEALTMHPSVEAAVEALNITTEQRREQFSGYFPEVSISGYGGRMYGDNSTTRGLSVTRGAAYSYTGEGSVSVRQMLFDGLETPNRVKAAQNRKLSAQSTVADIQEQLVLRAAQSYVNVFRARKGLELINAHVARVADYLERISTMVQEGASDETELQQANDIYVILQGIKADFEGQVLAAESQYAEATGALPEGIMYAPLDMSAALPDGMQAALDLAKTQHPAITSVKLTSKASEADVQAEKGILYPDFDGELSYLKSDKRDVIGGEAVDAKAIVRMNWNFSTGGAQFARIARTKHAHKEALARVGETQRQIERDVRLAYSELQTASRQKDLLEERRALNAKLFQAYQSQFEGARVNLLQLMQSHNQLFNTELETLNGEYRVISAQYGVLGSVGRLKEVLTTSAAPQGKVADVEN